MVGNSIDIFREMEAHRGRVHTLKIDDSDIPEVFFFLVDTSKGDYKMNVSTAGVVALAFKILAF